eukprot:Em0099g1a
MDRIRIVRSPQDVKPLVEKLKEVLVSDVTDNTDLSNAYIRGHIVGHSTTDDGSSLLLTLQGDGLQFTTVIRGEAANQYPDASTGGTLYLYGGSIDKSEPEWEPGEWLSAGLEDGKSQNPPLPLPLLQKPLQSRLFPQSLLQFPAAPPPIITPSAIPHPSLSLPHAVTPPPPVRCPMLHTSWDEVEMTISREYTREGESEDGEPRCGSASPAIDRQGVEPGQRCRKRMAAEMDPTSDDEDNRVYNADREGLSPHRRRRRVLTESNQVMERVGWVQLAPLYCLICPKEVPWHQQKEVVMLVLMLAEVVLVAEMVLEVVLVEVVLVVEMVLEVVLVAGMLVEVVLMEVVLVEVVLVEVVLVEVLVVVEMVLEVVLVEVVLGVLAEVVLVAGMVVGSVAEVVLVAGMVLEVLVEVVLVEMVFVTKGTDFCSVLTIVDERSPIQTFKDELQAMGRGFSSSICFDGSRTRRSFPGPGSQLYTLTDEDYGRVKALREWAEQHSELNSDTRARPLVSKSVFASQDYTILSVWDGTKFPLEHKQYDYSYSETASDPGLSAAAGNLAVPVVLYDNHTMQGRAIRPAQFVRLSNVHATRLKGYSFAASDQQFYVELCIHKGTQYGSGATSSPIATKALSG